MNKEPEIYTQPYCEIANLLDCESAEKIYDYFKELSINFPRKLYNQQYVKDHI